MFHIQTASQEFVVSLYNKTKLNPIGKKSANLNLILYDVQCEQCYLLYNTIKLVSYQTFTKLYILKNDFFNSDKY
jgi:hypothetical protein